MKLSTLGVLASAALMTVSSLTGAAPFGSFNIAVFSAVPQTGTAPLNNSTNINILELGYNTAAQAAPIQTINASTGATPLFTSGSATSTGYLSLSNDRSQLNFTGHTNAGSASVNVNTILTRGVGAVDVNGNYTQATTYRGATNNQTRGAATLDGTNFQVGDQNGLYTNGGTAAAASGNFRSIKPFGGTFYTGRASTTGTIPIVSSVTGPLSGPTVTGLAGLPANNNTLQDFYLVQSAGTGTYDTLYLATTAGISKFSFSGASWVAQGTATITGGLFGLAARSTVGGNGFELFVTTGGGGATNNVLRYIDTAAFNASISLAAPTTLYSAPAGTVLKGIDFVPGSAVQGPAIPFTAVRSIAWQGAAGNTWDTNPANLAWTTNAGTSSTFYSQVGAPVVGDNVTFGATGAGTVAVQAGGVVPNSVNITGGNYTFTGGPIASGTDIVKSGLGTLTFANASNTASGNFNVLAGTVQLSTAEQMPVRSAFSNGTTLRPTASFSNAASAALLVGVADASTLTVDIAVGQTNLFGNFGNPVVGTGTKLRKVGSGDLVLALASGGGSLDAWQIDAGRLVLDAPTTPAIPTLSLNASAPGEINGDIVLKNYARLNFNSGTFSGTGSLIIQRGSDATSGIQGTQISIANTGTAVQGNLALNIVAQPAIGEATPLRFNFGATAGNTLTFSGSIIGDFAVNFSVGRTGGAGLLILANTSTYTGNSFVNSAAGAIFRNGIANPLPSTTRLTFGETNNASGTWDLSGYDLTIAALETGATAGPTAANAGTIANVSVTPATLVLTGSNTGAGLVSFRGSIGASSGAQPINVTKSGAYVQELAGPLNNVGTYTATGGFLVLNTTFLPLAKAGALVANNSATLELGGPRSGDYTRVAEVSNISVSGGGIVRITPTGGSNKPAVVVTDALSLTSGGFFDLADNDLIVRGTPIADLRDAARRWILSSSGGNDGLGSTTADKAVTTVAVFPNSAGSGVAFYDTYDGVPLVATDIIVKYTYVGDTNLDGALTSDDLVNILEGLSLGLTGWQNGDLNYDGVVNSTDLGLYNAALPFASSPLSNGQGGGSNGGGAIPEPSALGLLAAALPLVTRRRR